MTPETKILKARTTLLWDHPFFGALAVQLAVVEKPDLSPPTMATDGRHLFYHPEFVKKLSMPEMVFVMAHEVLHNAFEHHIRRQSRDPLLWNVACDYAINGELVEAKLTMPKMGLLDPQFTGMSAEAIYRLIEEDLPPALKGRGGGDPGGCGTVIDGCAQHDESAVADLRAQVQMQVRQAAAIAKGLAAGKLPAGIERLIERLTKPVVDWRTVLRRFIDESLARDYSWMRPNRRFLDSGFVLPGMVADGIGHLVVAIDTSGSIDEKALIAFASEVNGAFSECAIDKVTVIYADAEVHRTEEYLSGDVLDFRPAGGGGTAFAGTFDWIAKNAGDASAIIYFTDLEVWDFGNEPDAPVLWAVYGHPPSFKELAARTPFGEAISISEDAA